MSESYQSFEAVVMGLSMGGLDALTVMIPRFPKNFGMPVIVVQHRRSDPDSFLSLYLDTLGEISVKEAEDKETIRPGIVYIAPADYHLMVEEDRTFSLSVDAPVQYARPSIDILFETAAEAYLDRLVGVIMTGANADGRDGLAKIKALGGRCIVQDPSTATSDTMPRSAMEAIQPDHVVPLEKIVDLLIDIDHLGTGRTNRNHKQIS